MNERIKELSDIAYKNHLAKNPHSSFGRRPDYDKEFAELIVRECVELIRDSDWAYDVPDDDYDPNAVAMIAADGVAKHFGVE